MSINIKVRTKKKDLDYNRVLHSLADGVYPLVVKFMQPEICEFYQHSISTRPIDISLEDNGYEIRITTLACREDYELFAKTIDLVQKMVDGKVYYEDDDEERIEDVNAFFGSEWIEKQMEVDANMLLIMILGERVNISSTNDSHEVGLFGPVCQFYLGRNLLKDLNIDFHTDRKEASDKLIERFRYSQYSRPHDIRRTTTSMTMNVNNKSKKESDVPDRLTFYMQNAYDMISRANYFMLVAHDEKHLLLEYNDFMKVAPEHWERFDNCQYFTTPLSDKQFKAFWDRAREFCIDKPAPELEYDERLDNQKGKRMTEALFFADLDYVRNHVNIQNLPPCAKIEPSKDGTPPFFYAIAKCQEIIFGSDDYAEEYMPVVLEMRKRARTMLDFWEKEMGIPEWNFIPFKEFSDMFYIPDELDTIADVMGFEPKDFREAGFGNSDLLLYMDAVKLDFKSILNKIRAGVDPDLIIYPASDKDNTFCASEDTRSRSYSDFKYLYALYRWYIETGEMVSQVSDCGAIIRCAAYLKMYEFMKDYRNKYLKH
ncbi:MAG: hypothetical protein IJK41_02290 [Muribaculaceae bacterium]|nr:hypothetical protein [Muribaculaceae bacterium]